MMHLKHSLSLGIGTLAFILMASYSSIAQDRIFSIGYTKNFVNEDSSNLSFTIDINRMPGKSEGAGTYYIVNTPSIGKTNFFVKPTADVNLGSYTTLAANNIAIGLPFGLSFKINPDDPNNTSGIFWASVEVGPDFVADKNFDSYLFYFSPGANLNYSFQSKKELVIDFGIGFKYGLGERMQSVKTKLKNSYRKFIVPVGLAISAFKSKDDSFHHLKFSGIYKFNKILKDDPVFSPSDDRIYTQLKLDLYFLSQLGFNVTYTSGFEEPLFKKVNSISFGITLARKG